MLKDLDAVLAVAFVENPPQKQDHERRELERVRNKRNGQSECWIGHDCFDADGGFWLRQEIADEVKWESVVDDVAGDDRMCVVA